MIKRILSLFAIFAGLALLAYYWVFDRSVVPTEKESVVVTIPTGSAYQDVKDSLVAVGIEVGPFFDLLADRMNYRRDEMRPGKFLIRRGVGPVGLIRRLRNGSRETVDVVLTTEREPENVAAKVARFLEADSLAFVRLFQDRAFIDSLGYTPETFMTLFIPNTYELYWDATPRDFVTRMVKEHRRFWESDGRMQKAKQLGLTPDEVYTLASIVEKESLQAEERPRIAGVYLNRIRQGIRLQADPTAVFATREFGIPRVLNRHIEYDNPYNTYMYAGLPPGPITMASTGSIDAVLNPENHEYIYFCARGDGSGFHNFAKTLAGHGRNKAVYVANLRARGLR